ncbi:MAG: choice-of-anchor tandem repeat GloVer-containing protein [Bryobacteraceae bacterium]
MKIPHYGQREILMRGRRTCAILALVGATAIALPAQIFTVLYDFCSEPGCLDGKHPVPAMIQGVDGNLYGCGYSAGLYGGGNAFKLTPDGQMTIFYNFCSLNGCADGINPYGDFTLAPDGNFYGATWFGGAHHSASCQGPGPDSNGCGTVFKLTPAGALTTLYNFCAQSGCRDGFGPEGALLLDAEQNLYGTAWGGGANGNYGTIFKLSPSGQLKTLYSFCPQSGCPDGYRPSRALVQDSQWNFYGTARNGGANGQGTLWERTRKGQMITLYSFCSQPLCTDGATPVTVVLASDGSLYGITTYGGAFNYGTFFKMSPGGQPVVLHSFCALSDCIDGAGPISLIEGTDGNFYGFTEKAQGHNNGTVFKITPDGVLTTLQTLCQDGVCADGAMTSVPSLVEHTSGVFYGTVGKGGNSTSDGTLFSLSVGLGRFVKPVPNIAAVGGAVRILGTNLTGATSVSFNGTAAVFNVVSATEITTTVPAGAPTGTVKVVTPGGTLSSGVPFEVQ